MKTNLKVYTLTGAGTEIANFNVDDTYEKYIIKGSATSIGNYAISVVGTPQAGETFIVKYKGVLDITTNGNTFSILGQSLTQNQLISDLDIEAYYDGSAWIVEIKPSFTSSVVENTNLVNSTIANAKLAQMAAYTIKANNTASSAVPQDVDACTLMSRCAWLLNGNSGTTPGTNFIGTTDANDLIIKVNNVESGRISNTLFNLSLGKGVLPNITTGYGNTAIGNTSSININTGFQNTAIGQSTLTDLVSGTHNTSLGATSGQIVTTGVGNTTLGFGAKGSVSNSNYRIALGYGANATADYQFALPDDVTKFKWRGVTYTMPSANAAGVLTNDGSGVLTWS